MAFRYGFTVKGILEINGLAETGCTKHIDLQDWLSNYNAIRMNGGLNLLAKVLGKPGRCQQKEMRYTIFS